MAMSILNSFGADWCVRIRTVAQSARPPRWSIARDYGDFARERLTLERLFSILAYQAGVRGQIAEVWCHGEPGGDGYCKRETSAISF